MKALSISVITPSFNQADFLEKTIQSVINQNYPALEYIIIDGGSTDSSLDVIKRYTNHIAYWVSEKDKGQSDAINKGLKRATGDIVCWLNSDDLFEPNTLHTVGQYFLEHSDAQFLYGDGIIFYEDRNKQNFYIRPGIVDRKILSCRDPLQQPSTFWRRSIHDEIGFIDETLNFTMDWDFFIRVGMKYDMQYLPVPLSRYRIHDAHKTGSGASQRSDEVVQFIKKYSDYLHIKTFNRLYPHVDEIRYLRKHFGWRVGRLMFRLKHPLIAISEFRRISSSMDMY